MTRLGGCRRAQNLADLRTGQVDDVARQLRARGGDRRAQPAELGDAVTVDVPGHVGVGQPEQLGNRLADLRGLRPERRGRAAGSEQGDDGDPGGGLREPHAMPGQLTEQGGQRGTERGGHGLLGVSATGHHGAGVRLHLRDQSIPEATEPAVQRGQRTGQLQCQPGSMMS